MLPLPPDMEPEELRRAILLLGGDPTEKQASDGSIVHEPEEILDLLLSEACAALNGMMQQLPLFPDSRPTPLRAYGPRKDFALDALRVQQLALQLGVEPSLFGRPGQVRSVVRI